MVSTSACEIVKVFHYEYFEKRFNMSGFITSLHQPIASSPIDQRVKMMKPGDDIHHFYHLTCAGLMMKWWGSFGLLYLVTENGI